MAFDGIKTWYKNQPFARRFVLISSIVSTPILMNFLDDFKRVSDLEEQAKQRLNVEETKFNKAKSEKSKVPALEEKFTETQSKLDEASRMLPSTFQMDSVLEKTSLIAQNSGVQLKLFQPNKPEVVKSAYKYMRMPIKLSINGSYAQIAIFFDQMLHLELLTHIGSFSLKPSGKSELTAPTILQDIQRSLENSVKRSYTPDIDLASEVELEVFRSLTQDEIIEAEKKLDSASNQKTNALAPLTQNKGVN